MVSPLLLYPLVSPVRSPVPRSCEPRPNEGSSAAVSNCWQGSHLHNAQWTMLHIYTRVVRIGSCYQVNLARGAAGPIPFHASRRACGFYSWYRLRPTWRAPEKSKDIVARARPFRVRQFAWLVEAPRRSSANGTEVSAGRHKSDCRSTAGEDQQGLRFCGLEGRRCMQ